jgi:hypothetical protein
MQAEAVARLQSDDIAAAAGLLVLPPPQKDAMLQAPTYDLRQETRKGRCAWCWQA